MRVPSAPGTARPLAGFLILAGGVLVLALSACGLFDIRDEVEPDDVNPACVGENASSSDNVLSNFELALTCRKDGSALLARSLDDRLGILLDAQDIFELAQLGVPRDSLTRSETLVAHDRIMSGAEFADSTRFQFSRVVPQVLGGNQAFYELMPYELEVYVIEGDTARLATLYSGTVNLTVAEQQAGSWAISRWLDSRDNSGNRTFGYLYAVNAPASR